LWGSNSITWLTYDFVSFDVPPPGRWLATSPQPRGSTVADPGQGVVGVGRRIAIIYMMDKMGRGIVGSDRSAAYGRRSTTRSPRGFRRAAYRKSHIRAVGVGPAILSWPNRMVTMPVDVVMSAAVPVPPTQP